MAKDSSANIQLALTELTQHSENALSPSWRHSAPGASRSPLIEKRRHMRIEAFNNESINALSFNLFIGAGSTAHGEGLLGQAAGLESTHQVPCKVLDYSALGIGVEIELGQAHGKRSGEEHLRVSDLRPGVILTYELRIGTLRPFFGRGLICNSLLVGSSSAETLKDSQLQDSLMQGTVRLRLGIQFFYESEASRLEGAPDRRREHRFTLPHVIAPLAICNDSVRFGERLYLEVREISSSGMKAVMAAGQGFVTPHMSLELVIRIPCFGTHQVFAQVTHVIHSSAWNQIEIGARFLMSSKDFSASLAQFVRVFLDQEIFIEVEDKRLLEQKKSVRKFSKGFVFEKELLEKYYLLGTQAGGIGAQANATTANHRTRLVDSDSSLVNDPVCYVSKNSKFKAEHESSLLWRLGQAQFDADAAFEQAGLVGFASAPRAAGISLSCTCAYGFVFPFLFNSKTQDQFLEEYFERCLIFSAICALVSSSQVLMFDFSNDAAPQSLGIAETAVAGSGDPKSNVQSALSRAAVVSDLKHFLCDLGFHSTTFSDQVLYIETESLFQGKDIPVDLWFELVREALQVEPRLFQKIGRPALWRRLLMLFQ